MVCLARTEPGISNSAVYGDDRSRVRPPEDARAIVEPDCCPLAGRAPSVVLPENSACDTRNLCPSRLSRTQFVPHLARSAECKAMFRRDSSSSCTFDATKPDPTAPLSVAVGCTSTFRALVKPRPPRRRGPKRTTAWRRTSISRALPSGASPRFVGVFDGAGRTTHGLLADLARFLARGLPG